ncbi:MFS transporter [Kitasatospora sp. LaBMicrA B282]|uniref:MFS transporter n=1 Tax=Kitasatospora sp. LaBMicrA B282 TaxID=3420949 RepID=UPI003D0CD1C5
MTSPAAKPPLTRNEKLFVPAVFITNLGNNIQLIAASLLAYKATGTTLSVGWVFIASAIPQVLLSVYFGRVADRVDRRTLCVLADTISMVAAAALPTVILLGGNPEVAAYVTSFVLSAVAALYMPASAALMKERISDARMARFSANYEIASQAGFLISATIGGVAVQFVGTKPLFYFNAATFALSALLTWAMGRRVPAPVQSAEEGEQAAAAAEQTRRANRSLVLRLGALFVVSATVITVVNTLLLVLVIHKFKMGAAFLGLTDAAAGVGFTLGATHFKRLQERFDYRVRIVVGLVSTGLIEILMPLSVWSLLPLIFAAGYTFGLGRLTVRTELMKAIHESRAGRVFGTANAVGLASALVATLALSQVSDHVSVSAAFMILGLVGAVPAALVTASLARTRPAVLPVVLPEPEPVPDSVG